MKLWKDNRLAGEYEIPNDELCSRFMVSHYFLVYCPQGMPISSALLSFFTEPESEGGLSSTFEGEDAAFMQIVDMVIEREIAKRRCNARDRVRK